MLLCALVVSYVAFFFPDLFFISPSFGALGRLCFVIVSFPRFCHLHINISEYGKVSVP